MMYTLRYFYRHADPIYFSLEKLFTAISRQISAAYGTEFGVTERFLPYPTKWRRLLSNIRFVKKNQADINHITGDVHYAILACSKTHINILTVHDCVLLHTWSRRNPRYWILKWFWYDLPVRKADMVTVISEKTKKELLRFTKCDPEKIRVIPNFADTNFYPSPAEFKKELPRILFIGSTANKNLERLVEAIEGIKVELDIVGRLNEEQLLLLRERRILYRQSSGLTQEALLEKYIDCDLLAFPSTYEGFGLPIIEAQAIGRPVLTSNIAPMQEVSGGAASLVDPYDIASIRKGIYRILDDEAYRNKIVEDGFSNVERFRLSGVADRYASLYKELLEKKNKIAC